MVVYDDVYVTGDEADLEVTLSPLSDEELTSLSHWQREQVEGLVAEGQRCLYDAWNSVPPAGEYLVLLEITTLLELC